MAQNRIIPEGLKSLWNLAREWGIEDVEEAGREATRRGWRLTDLDDNNGDRLYSPPKQAVE